MLLGLKLECPLQARQESLAQLWDPCALQAVPGSCLCLPQAHLLGCPNRPRQHPGSGTLPPCSFVSAHLGPGFTAFGSLGPQVACPSFLRANISLASCPY